MKRLTLGTLLVGCLGGLAWAQSPQGPAKAGPHAVPRFDATDVQVSPKTTAPNVFLRIVPVRAGRYEVRRATMVDLIRIAYGVELDKILGGPSWLEMDRFDIVGKVPDGSTPEAHRLMLQSALEDRFKLVLHKDTRFLPAYALTMGRKHQLREASGTEDSGCTPQSTAPAGAGPDSPAGGLVLMMASANGGSPVTLRIGPGGTIQYRCRNMTMSAFAANLRSMFGANVGTSPVLDETGLTGRWNFDIEYSMGLVLPGADSSPRISITEAVDRQLGLKLEERPIPTAVLVVDSVLRTPTPNAPDVATALPPIPLPTEFEVASVKMTDPTSRAGRFQSPPGRFLSEGMPMPFLLQRAFNTMNSEQIVGMPSFSQSERYDINAIVPGGAVAGPTDPEALAPMLLSLLKERFKLAYHTEERPVTTYSLVSAGPKMKKADPESRAWCKTPPPSPATPPGSRVLTCQNVTMAEFAERLRGITPELAWPVTDATGLDGTWDLTLTFSMFGGMPVGVPGAATGAVGGGPGAFGGAPSASDPSGIVTIFQAIEKLGLKLERQKRPMPVIVIDRLERTPTEN